MDRNYCRNPTRKTKSIWCYTTDPEVRWEYCDPIKTEKKKTTLRCVDKPEHKKFGMCVFENNDLINAKQSSTYPTFPATNVIDGSGKFQHNN